MNDTFGSHYKIIKDKERKNSIKSIEKDDGTYIDNYINPLITISRREILKYHFPSESLQAYSIISDNDLNNSLYDKDINIRKIDCYFHLDTNKVTVPENPSSAIIKTMYHTNKDFFKNIFNKIWNGGKLSRFLENSRCT